MDIKLWWGVLLKFFHILIIEYWIKVLSLNDEIIQIDPKGINNFSQLLTKDSRRLTHA